MKDYDAERAAGIEKIAAIEAKFNAVAKILKLNVTKHEPEAHPFRAVLWSNTLFMEASAYGKWRINVHGQYPHYARNGGHVTVYAPVTKKRWDGTEYASTDELHDASISISSDKTPEQIAQDIQRRFMPAYEKRLALVLERIKENDEYYQSGCETLSAVLGRKVTADEAKNRAYQFYETDGCSGNIKVSRGGVEINVDYLSIEAAKKIWAIIQTVKRVKEV